MGEWKELALDTAAIINPTESLSKGVKAKKIAMTIIQPFTKRVHSYSVEKYNGGMKFRNGDTLVARITPCLENGKTVFVDILDDGEIGFGSTEYIVLREKQGTSDKDFLYYFAISPEFRDVAILSMTGSSGRQRVQTDVVRNHLFSLPPLPEQKAIASVLSSLDDKIELLHRQNKTLEAMAETLFRQWFVEEAQEGWEKNDIYSLIDVVYGFPFKSKFFNDDKKGHPLIRIRNLKNGFSNIYTDEECDEKHFLNCGDLVAGMDGEFRLYIWSGEKSLLNQRACKFIPKHNYVPTLFVFSLMKTHLHYYENVKVGTTVIHLCKSDIDEIRIHVPPKEVLIEFGKIAACIHEKIKNNSKQIRTLEKLRDTLLPKLMSGEVRVEYEN